LTDLHGNWKNAPKKNGADELTAIQLSRKERTRRIEMRNKNENKNENNQ